MVTYVSCSALDFLLVPANLAEFRLRLRSVVPGTRRRWPVVRNLRLPEREGSSPPSAGATKRCLPCGPISGGKVGQINRVCPRVASMHEHNSVGAERASHLGQHRDRNYACCATCRRQYIRGNTTEYAVRDARGGPSAALVTRRPPLLLLRWASVVGATRPDPKGAGPNLNPAEGASCGT